MPAAWTVTGERREQEKRGGPNSEERSQDSFLPIVDKVLEGHLLKLKGLGNFDAGQDSGSITESEGGTVVGCRRCSALGFALLDPCMGVVDGGLHEFVPVRGSVP